MTSKSLKKSIGKDFSIAFNLKIPTIQLGDATQIFFVTALQNKNKYEATGISLNDHQKGCLNEVTNILVQRQLAHQMSLMYIIIQIKTTSDAQISSSLDRKCSQCVFASAYHTGLEFPRARVRYALLNCSMNMRNIIVWGPRRRQQGVKPEM